MMPPVCLVDNSLSLLPPKRRLKEISHETEHAQLSAHFLPLGWSLVWAAWTVSLGWARELEDVTPQEEGSLWACAVSKENAFREFLKTLTLSLGPHPSETYN